MKLLIIILFATHSIILSYPLNIKDNVFDVRKIPVELLKSGGAVIRIDNKIFKVDNYKSATLTVKYAVTIFNKEQQKYGRLSIWYDKFRKISELDAVIYDAQGEEIRDLEKADIKDYSDFEKYFEYNDNRTKFIEMYYDKFPYTVEFNYELEYDGYLGWPSWSSRSSLEPVEYTSFKVIAPENYKLGYWCNADSIKPTIKKLDDDIAYLWEQKLLPKLSYDAVGEDLEDISLVVKIAPSDFEIDGHRGKIDSWQSFGLWYYNLYKDRCVLPESAQGEIDEKINSGDDEKEKIRILYKYLQSKTHYVSVQLGIGGWQPFDANYVYINGYGDCKALSNFMVAMLDYAGIKAYPVIINSTDYPDPILTDLPSQQFNHVIVCAPLQKDTIWLECTSNVLSPGVIGSENENRYALMVTPEGGTLIKTPSSKAVENLQIKKISVSLTHTGKAYASINIKYSGDQYDAVIYLAKQSTPAEKENYIKRMFEVPDISLKNLKLSFTEDENPTVNLNMDISLSKYGTVMGKRIFLNPNLMERRKIIPKDVEKRLSPVKFKYPYMDVDSIYYVLPENFVVETLPKETNLKSSFGSFISKVIQHTGNSILYIRELKIDEYSIAAEKYNEYKKFFSEVVNADKQSVVLINK